MADLSRPFLARSNTKIESDNSVIGWSATGISSIPKEVLRGVLAQSLALGSKRFGLGVVTSATPFAGL
jgi:hypothetical protein